MNPCISEKSLEKALDEYIEARQDGSWEEPVLVSLWDGENVLFSTGPRKFFRRTWLQQVKMWDVEQDICGPWETDSKKIVYAVADDLISDTLYDLAEASPHS
tara:strand:+ start:261 stop:566 length:306 start_codon:yes stop_codon:yes gene_type:complete